LALRSTPVATPILYLCDNQALLEAVRRWVGKGRKAKLKGAPDSCILLEAIEELREKKNIWSSDIFVQGESASSRTCK